MSKCRTARNSDRSLANAHKMNKNKSLTTRGKFTEALHVVYDFDVHTCTVFADNIKLICKKEII